MNFFRSVSLAASDPILGLNERFIADRNPLKVNLGMGVYVDDSGKLPLMRAVASAEASLASRQRTRSYLPIDGIAAFARAAKSFAFGSALNDSNEPRIATVQCLGGTGGLRVAADFLRQFHGDASVLISSPTWDNHRGIFNRAGFEVDTYPYYDSKTRALDHDGLCEKLRSARAGTIVVLHACCHNPTGVDLSASQWDEVVSIMTARQLLPVLDMAYQGFGEGVVQDSLAARKLLEAGGDFLVATSFSKSFSLYGERIGSLSAATQSEDDAARVLSQLKTAIRTNYSSPPTHGAALVTEVLGDASLRTLWMEELAEMRSRIHTMRLALREQLKSQRTGHDYAFVTRQIGMFTYSGLTAQQMRRLREEFSVYGVDNGRICVAGLNESNVSYVAEAIKAVEILS